MASKTSEKKQVKSKGKQKMSKDSSSNQPEASFEKQPTGTATLPSIMLQTPIEADPSEVVLTDAEGRRYCRSTDCDQIGLIDGYCRYHYLYHWKRIQNRKKILADGKLERYIDELTARYTDKFIEILRKDLRTEKDFLSAVQELELDDSSNGSSQDEDEAKTYIEEISGMQSESSRDDDGY